MIKKLVIIVIALFVPVLIITSSIWITAHPWFIKYEYQRIAFPADMSIQGRTQLALIGLHSVMPGGRGIELLKEAKLPDGRPAFNDREIGHMADVRKILNIFFLLTLLGVLAMICAAFVTRKKQFYATLLQGFKWGALLTLIILFGLIAAMSLNFDSFFLKFHYLFFEGDSFLFDLEDTLLRLYPEEFWADGALFVGILSIISALAMLVLSQRMLKRLKSAHIF